ncbi:MAG: TlpA disulfide reductase family protein [Pseudomonadales bacterium]|nr:TlpA disulfide reductase family protein [Pseudomonadales bacterium]
MKLLIMTILVLLSACQKPNFYDVNGRGYSYANMEEKWLLINYWATWCGPCIKEISEFNGIANDFEDVVVVLGVNFESVDRATNEEHIEKMGIEFPVYAEDPYEHFNVDRPVVLPTTIVISPGGKVHDILVGPQTRETLLAALGLD